MITFLTVLHILVCLFLILVVLLQAGKGGGMGIAFGGGGGSQTVFGSSGAGNFLTRLTSVTAAIFLVTSLGLAHYSSQQDSKRLQRLAEQKQVEKKADDERAAKLTQEIEKARENAAKQVAPPAAGIPTTVPVPAAGSDKTGADRTTTTMAKKKHDAEGTGADTADKTEKDAAKPAKPAKPAKSARPTAKPAPKAADAEPRPETKGEATPPPPPTAPPAAQ